MGRGQLCAQYSAPLIIKYCVVLLSPWLWNHFLHPYNVNNNSEQLVGIELELNEILRTRYLASCMVYHKPGINRSWVWLECHWMRWYAKDHHGPEKWSKSSWWLSLVHQHSPLAQRSKASRGLMGWRPNTHFIGKETEDGAEPCPALGQLSVATLNDALPLSWALLSPPLVLTLASWEVGRELITQ